MMTVNAPRAVGRARWVLGCALILSSLSHIAPAGATGGKPKPTQESASQSAARGLLDRGRAELKAGHPEQALSSFQAARQLDDSLPASEGIADADLALGRAVAAYSEYTSALEKRRSSLSPSALSLAEAKLAALNAATAQLKLDVQPEGVEVRVDGSDVGRSPLSAPLVLDPGTHQIQLLKPDFVTLTEQWQLERGSRTENRTLAPEVVQGSLRVTTSSPQGVAELLIDGRPMGLLPWEGALPVGKATLLARTSDATSQPLEVTVARDVTTPVVLTLEPNTGTLDVSCATRLVRISVDGRPVGVQNWRGPLAVGAHHLTLARDGYRSQERDLRVQSAATVTEVDGRWVPLPGAPSTLQAANDHGLYFRLDLTGRFSNTSDGITAHCADAPSDARCSSHAPLGGGLGLRIGYRFKWIAPEVWGLGSLDVSYVRAHYDSASSPDEGSGFYGQARREDYIFFRYGWAAGVGVRATTPTSGVSATGGVGFGVFSQWGQYARTTTGSAQKDNGFGGTVSVPAGQSASSGAVHTYAPGLLLDGGVLLGSSPGAKLYLGIVLAVEFAPEHAPVDAKQKTFAELPYGTPGLDIASGTQYHFGPVLGFQFGY